MWDYGSPMTTIICDKFSDVTPTTPNTLITHTAPTKLNAPNTLTTTTKFTIPTHTTPTEPNAPTTLTTTTKFTPPTHTTPTSTATHTIYHTTMHKIDQTCHYFQKGKCNFGDKCKKWHLHPATNICPICSKKCDTLRDFRLHMQLNHDPSMPSCDQCSFKCRRMGTLDQHMKTEHNSTTKPTTPDGYYAFTYFATPNSLHLATPTSHQTSTR